MQNLRTNVRWASALILIIIFCWTAGSKATDFIFFTNQLKAVPGIGDNNTIVGMAAIALLVICAILLCFDWTRQVAFWCAIVVALCLAVYIFYILQSADNLPCNCLGWFKTLSWRDNLLLTLGLASTALVGIATGMVYYN